MDRSLFERLVRFDRTRKSFPGEHWFALTAGLWFLRRKGNSLPARLLSKTIGAALIARAASGDDGLRKLFKKDGAPGAVMDRWQEGRPLPEQDELPAVSAPAPRAALLQPPDPAARVRPEAASGVRAGGFPDFR